MKELTDLSTQGPLYPDAFDVTAQLFEQRLSDRCLQFDFKVAPLSINYPR